MSDVTAELLMGAAVLFGIYSALKSWANKKRRAVLLAKYGDQGIVNGIMQRKFWQGMSEEQLIDSLGHPPAKDQKSYKTKSVEIFKYSQNGKNRYRTRVRVENGVVVGWELK